jgi:AraC-like DNA-binding protein/mannose-6-phosphate isomerase-like protein (cupin superfamily)
MRMRQNISNMRQPVVTCYDPKGRTAIATLAWDYPRDANVSEHAHGAAQLIYAIRGVMNVCSGQSMWVIPPQFAMWIPAGVPHNIRMTGEVSMRTLYLKGGVAPRMPAACAVLHVTPLLRELTLEAVRIGRIGTSRLHRAMRDLIVEELSKASPVPITLTMPVDERARAVAAAAMESLAKSPSLRQLCGENGTSVRTVQRAFRQSPGISFESWRRQARLMRAIELLAAGRRVKEAAFETGYRQPSAFVQLFRLAFGVTPKCWMSMLATRPEWPSSASRASSPRGAGDRSSSGSAARSR